jgi:hypothetical protein
MRLKRTYHNLYIHFGPNTLLLAYLSFSFAFIAQAEGYTDYPPAASQDYYVPIVTAS